MRGWKREHRFNSDLAIYISLLILGTVFVYALLMYESYLRAAR